MAVPNAVLNLTNAVLSAILAGDVVSLVTSNANGSFADADVGDGKTVAITGLFLAGADAENYSITQPEATADIKRALSVTGITAADKTYDGTMTVILNVANAAISGVVPGDDVELNASAATGEFVDKNAAIGKTVSIDGLSITGTDASKYLLTKTTAIATINPAALVVSASGINKLYDGSNSASVTLNDNRLSNDNLTVSYTSAEFSDKAVGGSKPIAIDGISISGIDAVNYIINSSATTTADILQRALTVTVVGGNKTYDASTAASIILSDDRVSGDSLTVGFSSANFADKNAGTGKTVTVNGVNLSGPDAVNYSLSSSTLTGIADITARALLITATGQSRGYDGTSVAVVALADDRVPGDLFTSTYVSASFQDKNTGLAKGISVTGIAITGTDAGNYIANTTSSTTADINPAPLSVTGIIANNKTYDGTVTATVLTSSAALNGRIAGDDVLLIDNAVTAAFAGAQPGTGKAVTISGLTVGGADASNYVLNQPTAQADILAAELTVTGLIASDKTYDGSSNAVVNFSNASLMGVISGDVVTIDSSAAVANFADKNVGIAKVVEIRGLNLSGQDAGKYVLTQPATNATITPADLTVTANGASRVYGGPDPAFSANLSGFVGGDDATVVSGTPSFSTTATVTSAPGAYSITPALGSLTALNYEFSSFIAGTLAVTTAGTTNSLWASANPSRESSNVVFIVMLTPLAPATGIPGGAVVFAVNGTPFSTNSLVNGETSASTFSLPVGTNLITAEYLGDTNFSGSTNSLQQVVEPTCSQINNLLGMSDNSDGTFTLSFTGTPGGAIFRHYIIRYSAANIQLDTSDWKHQHSYKLQRDLVLNRDERRSPGLLPLCRGVTLSLSQDRRITRLPFSIPATTVKTSRCKQYGTSALSCATPSSRRAFHECLATASARLSMSSHVNLAGNLR